MSKFIFKKQFLESDPEAMGIIDSSAGWVDEIDGKEVIFSDDNELYGICNSYYVHVDWCIEIDDKEEE